MQLRSTFAYSSFLGALLLIGCGSDDARTFAKGSGGSAGSAGASGSSSGGSAGSGGATGGAGGGAGTTTGGAGGSAGSSGSGGAAGGAAGSGGGSGCPSGQSDCNGTCVNLATDGKNCGFCGHDCQTASCSGGGCEPTGVALESNIAAIAVDATHVYFTQTGTPAGSSFVKRVAKGGGTVNTLASNQNSPSHILVSDKVYFGGAIFVRSMAKTGGATTTLTPFRPSRFAENNSQLFLSYFNFSGGSTYDIRRVNKAGGGEGLIFAEDKTITSLAATGSEVFWTKVSTSGIRKKSVSAPAGGAPTVMFGTEPALDVQVEGTDLLWTVTNTTQWHVRKGTFAGAGAASVVTLPASQQGNLTVTNDGIFWTEQVGGITVLRTADRDGKNVRTLSADLGPNPAALAAEPSAVFYKTPGGIFRVPR